MTLGFELFNNQPENSGDAGKIPVGRHVIYHGDCRDSLKMIKDSSVHLVVTSPPYNVGIEYRSSNDNLPFDQYLAFTKSWLEECYRVLVSGGRICINVPIYTHKNIKTSLLVVYYSLLKEVGFQDREIIIWVKKRRSDGQLLRKDKLYGTLSPRNPQLNCPSEVILIMNKVSPRLEGKGSDISLWEYRQWNHNIWEMDTESDRTHPAPFPPELPKRLIKFYSFPKQVVLDPFLGSGTTMKVADELNRTCIGCELDRFYVEMAMVRMMNSPLMLTSTQPIPQLCLPPEPHLQYPSFCLSSSSHL